MLFFRKKMRAYEVQSFRKMDIYKNTLLGNLHSSYDSWFLEGIKVLVFVVVVVWVFRVGIFCLFF